MNSYFDLLVLAALFVPVALIVAANLAGYRSPGAGEGLLALPAREPAAEPLPEPAAKRPAAVEEMPELREAA
ncbi:MAG TPA: hypothetical protein VLS49_14235 [Usitatibacter sp.]|nr:hypothetical protein [Usitatibacter sp.]